MLRLGRQALLRSLVSSIPSRLMPLIMRRGPRRWIWWMRFGARQHERSASGPVVTRTSFGGGVGRRRVEQPDRRRAGGTTDRQPCSSSERSEEHMSELQSLMHISYDVFSLKKKSKKQQ